MRLSKIVLAVIAALACLPAQGAFAQTLAEIKSKGSLEIGTSGDGPPYTYMNDKNQLAGYDIEWAGLIGKALGVEIHFVRMPFPGLLPALQAGRIDMVMSALHITDERRKTFDFSVPYAYEAIVAIVPTSDTTSTGFDAIKGRIVTATANSAQEQAAKSFGGAKEVLSFKNGSDVYLALRTGQAEVGVTGLGNFAFYRALGNTDIRLAGEDTRPETLAGSHQGIVFRKGAVDLEDAVNAVVTKGIADGTYKALYTKYMGIVPNNAP